MGDCILWGEAAQLIAELLKETHSHFRLQVTGDKYAMTQADATLISIVAGIGGAKRGDIKRMLPYSNKPPVLYGRDKLNKEQDLLAEWFNMPQQSE